ncbi:MAG: HEAT repeat domain-containing protein [Woeseiaceae bacterium]|nr:HEAT repeat domain-containing protein [Woeseiaceae bacterium]
MFCNLRCLTAALLCLVLATPETGRAGNDPDPAESDAVLDAFTVAVLPTRFLSSDPVYEALARQVHAELQTRVAALENVHLADPNTVNAYSNTAADAATIGRAAGAGFVVDSRVAPAARGYSIRLEIIDSATANVKTSSMSTRRSEVEVDSGRVAEIVSRFMTNLESIVHPDRRPDRESVLQSARAVLLDPSRPDVERIEALRTLKPPLKGGPRNRYTDDGMALTGEVAAAALQLANESADPAVRFRVWDAMQGVPDPILTEPLLLALTGDDDRRVRIAAARALDSHLDTPGVRDALRLARDTDPDEFVRRTAGEALLSQTDLRAAAIRTIRDPSRTERERAGAVWQLHPFDPETTVPPDAELRATLIALATTARDPQIRQSLWYLLAQWLGESSVYPLVAAIWDEPNEAVRERMAIALGQYAHTADAEQALIDLQTNDASALVREAAEEALRQ